MSIPVFTNLFNATLSSSATSSSDTLAVSSSANLPSLAPGEILPVILNDASTGLLYEIVYVTAISSTTLTVRRAQEGTSALNWSAGDYIYSNNTAQTTAPIVGTLTPSASGTLLAANRLVVLPQGLTADITLTLPSSPNVGDEITVYGAEGYSVTVASGVTSGSPSFALPDGSFIFTWTINAGQSGQYIKCVWDGVNYRATTHGQSVSAPATQSNANVTLGQVLAATPQSRQQAYTPVSGDTYTISVTFTAPCNGFIFAAATQNNSADPQPANIEQTVTINGTTQGADNTTVSKTNYGVASVTAGTACTVTSTIAVGTSTGTFSPLSQTISSIFIPNP